MQVVRPKRRSERHRRHRVEISISAASIVKLLLALVLVWIAAQLWFPFLVLLLSVIAAVTLDPAVRWLEGRGMSRGVAVLTLGVASFALLGAALLVIVPPLSQQVGTLIQDFSGTRARVEREFPSDWPLLKSLVGQIMALPSSPAMSAWRAQPMVWARLAVEAVTGTLLVSMLALYLLLDGKRAYTWLLSYVPRAHRDRMAQTLPAVTEVVRAYVRGQVITSALCGAYAFIVLTALGVPAALPLALAAGVFDVIPILGTIAMTLAAAVVALTVSPFAAGVVFVSYMLYHLFEVYVLAPRVYGRSMRLSTLSVLLALIVGGVLQGALGAILILPLVAAYPIIERIWLAKYLGTEVVKDHRALAASAGTHREAAVETKILRGERHEGETAAPPAEEAAAPVAKGPPE